MNYIGIDCSLTSTAICIEDNDKEYYYNYNTKPINKWGKIISPICTHVNVYYSEHEEYSESEYHKVVDYTNSVGKMMNDFGDKIPGSKIGMEGYSYASAAGPLIDLVTLGSALRHYTIVRNPHTISIKAPMTVKVETCRIAYNILSKKVYRNLDGIAGGSFTKHQMLESLIYYNEHKTNKSPLYKLLNPYADELLHLNKIPKPIEDIVDSYWVKEIVKLS